MNWTFICPNCNKQHTLDWSLNGEIYHCGMPSNLYRVSTPASQTSAFVDTHNWPDLMESTVIKIKGNRCTVPNCTKKFETLDHRIPFSKGGKTSVDNLWPMCNEHNQSKGDEEYFTWVSSRK